MPRNKFTRKELMITIVSHYLETGVICASEIDSTITTLQSYSDNELLVSMFEAHNLREEYHASLAFRSPC